MGLSVFPAAAGGGIKQVQRGSASGAGTVTITAVDITKAFVNVFGTASSGTVATSGSISTSGNMSFNNNQTGMVNKPSANSTQIEYPAGTVTASYSNGNYTDYYPERHRWIYTATDTGTSNQSGNITGGSNNLVSAVVQGYLSGSTSLEVSGACRWEVVEFA